MKLKHYYAAYTPVRVICWIVFKKNEITSGAVYTPCGLSPGKYGKHSTISTILYKSFESYLQMILKMNLKVLYSGILTIWF